MKPNQEGRVNVQSSIRDSCFEIRAKQHKRLDSSFEMGGEQE